ncbi:MAG: AAA family ATPase, partial [Spirochaetales bacterium]|nr:AAA family ATPase [Spirochaetales bacterium]
IEYGNKQFGIEIKRSETIHEKYFSGLKYWMNLSETNANDMYLIYGGTENSIRNNMNVVGWDSIFDKIIKNAI